MCNWLGRLSGHLFFLNTIQIFEILVIASLKIQLFIAKSIKKYSFKRFFLKKNIINLHMFFSGIRAL